MEARCDICGSTKKLDGWLCEFTDCEEHFKWCDSCYHRIKDIANKKDLTNYEIFRCKEHWGVLHTKLHHDLWVEPINKTLEKSIITQLLGEKP